MPDDSPINENTELRAAVERVRDLARTRQTEAQDGTYTDADSLWLSEVLATLDGSSPEAGSAA